MKNTNIDNKLNEVSYSKNLFAKIFIFIIYRIPTIINSLISYMGGKFKMREDLQKVFKILSQQNTYTTYIDGFFGMGGSLKGLSSVMLEHGVKKVIVNDINTCIITMHKCIRDNRDEMVTYFLETIRKDILIPHGKLYISVEEFIEFKKMLVQRFYTLQDKREYGVETSILFIMLSSFNFSGVVTFKKGGIINFSNAIYDHKDIHDLLFNTIKRIDTFSELYNKFDMEFYNVDYFQLHSRFKGLKNTLWNIDTVYLKESYTEYIEEDMKKLTNDDIVGCECDYSQSDFNHIGVLETLENIDFIYNNNTHPILYHFINKFNLYYKEFIRSELITGDKDTEVKEVTELILYKDNFKTQTETNTQTNNDDYQPLRKTA